MRPGKRHAFYPFLLLATLLMIGSVFGTGCVRDQQLAQVNREQAATIKALNEEIARLNQELDDVYASREDLAKAKAQLEESLQKELSEGDMNVSMKARGLVVTVLDRILFDSGRAELKPSSRKTLEKVAEILSGKVKGHMVYVEGHTDNQPIRYSSWQSNWELSTARALEVVHFFVDQKDVDAGRIAAVGYGEHQPIAPNEDAEGRQKNRRVEIVISPKKMTP